MKLAQFKIGGMEQRDHSSPILIYNILGVCSSGCPPWG
jgi:hypothetical protein